MIAGKAVDFAAFARLDEVEGVEMPRLARQDLGELNADAVGHMVDGGNRYVGSGLFPRGVGLEIDVEVGCHILGRDVACLADASYALANGGEISCHV